MSNPYEPPKSRDEVPTSALRIVMAVFVGHVVDLVASMLVAAMMFVATVGGPSVGDPSAKTFSEEGRYFTIAIGSLVTIVTTYWACHLARDASRRFFAIYAASGVVLSVGVSLLIARSVDGLGWLTLVLYGVCMAAGWLLYRKRLGAS